MERSTQSLIFDGELKRAMKKKRLKNYDELADMLGVNRKTLYNWRMSPKDMPLLVFSGIYSILFDDEHRLKEIIEKAETCGINYENEE